MPVDRRASRVRQMFAAISHRYDLLNRLLSGTIDQRWRRRTVEILGKPSTAVLDVCTGTADLAREFVRAYGHDFTVVGVDFCRPMLEIGRRKLLPETAPDQFVLIEADAQRLPFPDAVFDIVTVAFGLRNVTDRSLGLSEMVRVCRPGGKVAILEFSMPQSRLLRRAYYVYFRRVLPAVGQAIAPNRFRAYEYLPESVLEFYTDEQMLAFMQAHGLRDTQAIPFTFGIANLYVGVRPAGSPGRCRPQATTAATAAVGYRHNGTAP